MAASGTGLKKKLTISPCKVDAGNITVDSSKKAFEVMLNPAEYTHGFTIKYNKKEALGTSATEPKFSTYKPESISFDMVIDGTGVVHLPESGAAPSLAKTQTRQLETVVHLPEPGAAPPPVKTQIKQLETVVYNYDGTEHEPTPVRLLWGSFIFFGRLETMSVKYTLFKPSGEPLRAKVSLAFAGFVSEKEETLKSNRSSPDLTHLVEVKAGDTLPLLCYRIYKNSTYYMKIAKENNLVNFRDLTPGMQLHFPPLR